MEKGLEAELIGLAGWSVYADARRLVLGAGSPRATSGGRLVGGRPGRRRGARARRAHALGGARLVEVRASASAAPGSRASTRWPACSRPGSARGRRAGTTGTTPRAWTPGRRRSSRSPARGTTRRGGRRRPGRAEARRPMVVLGRRAGQVLLRPLRRGGKRPLGPHRCHVGHRRPAAAVRRLVGDGAGPGRRRARARSLLRELRRLCLDDGDQPRYGASRQGTIDLQAAASGRVWELLLALRKAGVPILRDRPKDAPVVVDGHPRRGRARRRPARGSRSS